MLYTIEGVFTIPMLTIRMIKVSFGKTFGLQCIIQFELLSSNTKISIYSIRNALQKCTLFVLHRMETVID
jgi:hypothetical protein